MCLAGLLMACARPLTEGEAQMAGDIFGASLDLDRVRVAQGFALAPPPEQTKGAAPIALAEGRRPGLCDRTAPQARSGPPPAWALYHWVHFNQEIYRTDMAEGWPEGALFPQALIFAHELVHVWQWQNRTATGYRPARAALESLVNLDPYFYVPGKGGTYLEFGYEQQAALVEDYLCHALYDPQNPRRGALRDILAPHFPLARLDAALSGE